MKQRFYNVAQFPHACDLIDQTHACIPNYVPNQKLTIFMNYYFTIVRNDINVHLMTFNRKFYHTLNVKAICNPCQSYIYQTANKFASIITILYIV